MAVGGLSTFSPLIKSGDLVPLVTTAQKRLDAFPQIPTMKEKGFPETCNTWNGLFVPRKCPPTVVERLSQAAAKVMKDPAVISGYEKADLFLYHLDSAATLKLIEEETRIVANVVKKLGMRK